MGVRLLASRRQARLRALGDTVDDHIDQALMRLQDTTLVSLAADPPIVMPENLRKGRKTDIPWE